MTEPEKPSPYAKKPIKNADPNVFGGKNKHGLYVPMSDDEMEVLSRLIEARDLKVIIHGWGFIEAPMCEFGDLRLRVPIGMTIGGLAQPRQVHFLDLELATQAGMTLFRKREVTSVNGKPLMIGNGFRLEMIWDIAIRDMDPKIVKMIKPGAIGLTSRRQDRDTKEVTRRGNMELDSEQRFLLDVIEKGEANVREDDLRRVVKATKKAGYDVKKDGDGFKAPEVK